ncbi:hypothetical protein RB620_09380 [Paenibacillus sp. LHD-117]|uniref:hypothetical protein n=1 Tax=Paenibacillus sp. LHD-117 TaxID=3071412 RepID=UPI0027E097F0|nr:hypothetical protein [Paenibacillus sp. LHD-117]MDQ6419641.1 hypothetical protein [Paenibacillus sp. LHD-117]
MELYFSDRFFSAGTTDIMNEEGASVGTMDLESMLSASLSVYNSENALRFSGKFRVFSGKWEVLDGSGFEIGVLRARMSFFSKRYEYDAGSRGIYQIESPAFSNEYVILDENEAEIATFQKVSGWFEAGAFRLTNQSTLLDSYELIAVVMGVHSIQKAASNAAT